MSTVPTPAALFDLSAKRAAVIGGTGVLGGRFAQSLAAAGAEVAVLGRSEERGNAVVAEIEASGGRARFIAADVSDRAGLEAAAAELAQGGGIDILVNAAGVNGRTPFAELGDEEWERLLEVNLTSVFRASQIFAPQMSNRPDGASIINISSASSGPPLSRVFGYGAAKAGVNNVTQYLARELAPEGIRVNAILPGFFPAEQNRALLTQQRVDSIIGHTPMRRLGTPEELDGALLWLAAPRASSFVTGALIHVDGGFSAMTI
jgi:NAD(P)-dependent dehydrogenase (short-subunit alcohol dehydrogenase family)